MKIVYISDEKYIMPTTVSIVSLIENNKTDIGTIYIICDECSSTSIKKISEINTYKWKIEIINESSKKYDDLEKKIKKQTNTHVSRTAMLKFFLPELLYDVDRVLYLDGDVIINKNIKSTFDIDIDGYYMAAVEDLGNVMLCQRGEESEANRIGMKGNPYFNSGVMLLNLEEMRKDEVGLKLLEYRTYQKNYFMDQDAFNYCMVKKILGIPYKYNFRTPLFYESSFDDINSILFDSQYKNPEELINDMAILHLSANYKPWNFYMLYFTDIFMNYYVKSPYKEKEISLVSLEYKLWEQWYQLYNEHRSLLKSFDLALKSIENMDYKFPFEKIKRGSRVVLYGAGKVGRSFAKLIEQTSYCEVVLWVDTNYKDLNGINAPERMVEVDFDNILVAVMSQEFIDEIINSLTNLGVKRECIVTL